MSLGRFLTVLWSRRPRSRTALTLAWERDFYAGVSALKAEQYSDAERAIDRALMTAERFAPGDPRLSVSLDTLGALYRMQGKFAEAEPLCLRTLAIKERTHGPSHPNVASTLRDLVEIYRALGRPDAAEPYHARALAILEQAIGPDLAELDESLRRSDLLDPK